MSSSDIAPTQVPDEAAARAALEDGSADAWLHETGGTWVLTGKDEPGSQLQSSIGAAVSSHVLAANAAKAGTSMDTLSAGSRLTVDSLAGETDSTGDAIAQIAGFVFAMLFYFASLMFGMAIATAITVSVLVGTPLLAFGRAQFALCLVYAAIYSVGLVIVHWPYGWFVVGAGRNGMEYSVLLIASFLTLAWQSRPTRLSDR